MTQSEFAKDGSYSDIHGRVEQTVSDKLQSPLAKEVHGCCPSKFLKGNLERASWCARSGHNLFEGNGLRNMGRNIFLGSTYRCRSHLRRQCMEAADGVMCRAYEQCG